jgi:hypothetical protein
MGSMRKILPAALTLGAAVLVATVAAQAPAGQPPPTSVGMVRKG